jgi:hypothetical protein
MPLEPFTEVIRATNILEGRPVYVKSLLAKTHVVALDSDTDSDPDPD